MRKVLLPALLASLLGADALAAPSVSAPPDRGVPTLDPAVVLAVPWGSGGAMLARREGNESSPEAPMSFTVAASGDIYILDQVSSRVVRFNSRGDLIGELALPGDTFQDVEVTADGRLVVLDRLVRKSLFIIDQSNGQTREVPLEGEGVPEAGAVTSLLARADGVWVEVEHSTSVRVLDERLEPASRTVIPGRPGSVAGRALRAGLIDGVATISLLGRDGAKAREWRVQASEPTAPVRIAWLEDDAQGNVAVVLHVMRLDEDGMDVVDEWDEGAVYAADGTLRATLRSPWVISEYEQLREVDLGADGHLYQLAVTPEGVKIVRFGGGGER